MMTGEIGILNVGAGDTKLTFDPKKPEERKRAAAAVTDMLKRGFAILVQVGEKDGKPLYQRAEAFDPKTCEYIIVGGPPGEDAADQPAAKPSARKPQKGKPQKVRLKAEATNSVAVARSAGG